MHTPVQNTKLTPASNSSPRARSANGHARRTTGQRATGQRNDGLLDLARVRCLGEALRDATLTYNSNVALIETNRARDSERLSYPELRRAAERVSARLADAGFAAGERCAILMSNQSKWTVSGLGALWAGATLVPLDYKLTPREQLALLAHAKPQALVVEYPVWRDLLREPRDCLTHTLVLVTEAPKQVELGQALRWEDEPQRAFRYVGREREDIACIVYSSGTGGHPKGCMLTHHNYLEQAQALGRMYPMQESDRYFSILPTNHAIDFMCGMVIPFLFGAAVVHQRTLRPEFLSLTLKRCGITHMALVPRLLKTLEERIRGKLDALPSWQRTLLDGLVALNDVATARRPRHELSRRLLKPVHDEFGGRLRLVFCGGAFVDRNSAEFFYRLGIPVVIGYGLSEAVTSITLNDLSPFRAETVGRPVPGMEVEVRNQNAQDVGEIYVRGPSVMQGYLDEPELTQEVLVDGWLRTGDLGRFDASGHLRLVGRAKNMIVTEGGKNVYPEDIEATFEDVDGCEEQCVFASHYVWPERQQDERLVIVVRAVDGSPSAQAVGELRARNRHLADYKRLAGYVVWQKEFPRTASLKVKRGELAGALRGALDAASAVIPFEA